MHLRIALQYCTSALHPSFAPSSAPQYCTPVLHPSIAPQYYTPVLHPSIAHYKIMDLFEAFLSNIQTFPCTLAAVSQEVTYASRQ